MIQGAHEEAKSSEAVNKRREPRFTTDRRQMPDGTRKAVICWQDKSALSVPTEQHRVGSATRVRKRSKVEVSGV